MTDTVDRLAQHVALIHGSDVTGLDAQTRLAQIGMGRTHQETLVRQLAQEDGIAIETLATHRKPDSTERGLRYLAPFSQRAAHAFSTYESPTAPKTLGDLAKGYDAKNLSLSGSGPTHMTRSRVLMRVGSLFALAVAAPAVWATRAPDPVCAPCALSPAEQFAALATFTIPAAIIVTLATLAPALWYLSRRASDTVQKTKPV